MGDEGQGLDRLGKCIGDIVELVITWSKIYRHVYVSGVQLRCSSFFSPNRNILRTSLFPLLRTTARDFFPPGLLQTQQLSGRVQRPLPQSLLSCNSSLSYTSLCNVSSTPVQEYIFDATWVSPLSWQGIQVLAKFRVTKNSSLYHASLFPSDVCF